MHLPADQPASMTSSSGGIRISLQGGGYDIGSGQIYSDLRNVDRDRNGRVFQPYAQLLTRLSVLYSDSTFSRGGDRWYRWNTDRHQQASPWCVGGSDGAAVEAYGTLRNGQAQAGTSGVSLVNRPEAVEGIENIG